MPSRQWTVIWAKRRWGYLGHTLRRGDATICRRDMLALNYIRQGKGSSARPQTESCGHAPSPASSIISDVIIQSSTRCFPPLDGGTFSERICRDWELFSGSSKATCPLTGYTRWRVFNTSSDVVMFSRSSVLGCSGYSWSSMASYWMCIS